MNDGMVVLEYEFKGRFDLRGFEPWIQDVIDCQHDQVAKENWRHDLWKRSSFEWRRCQPSPFPDPREDRGLFVFDELTFPLTFANSSFHYLVDDNEIDVHISVRFGITVRGDVSEEQLQYHLDDTWAHHCGSIAPWYFSTWRSSLCVFCGEQSTEERMLALVEASKEFRSIARSSRAISPTSLPT